MRNVTAYFYLIAILIFSYQAYAIEPIIDLDAIDPTVDACQDFYQYACGNWLKNFQLPADRSAYARQVSGLDEETVIKLNGILADYAKGVFQVPAKYAKQLGNVYASCMDTNSITANTPAFLQNKFQIIDAIHGLQDLARVTAQLQLAGVNVFFAYGSMQDYADSKSMIGQLSQGGMSFADKGYYFRSDDKSLEIRNRFQTHVKNILNLAGESSDLAEKDAATILAFETAVANKALAIEDLQDSTQLNHPMDLAAISTLAPGFDWSTYFNTLGLTAPGKINVATPDFFQALSAILKNIPEEVLKTYMKWQVLHAFAASLSQNFVDEDFAFWKHYLSGTQEQAPRWKKCTQTIGANMPEALGEAYVNSFSDPNAIRNRAEVMIRQIIEAFGINLDSLTWLDESTRQAAKQKLAKVTDKVGFPSHWKNYDSLLVIANNFVANSEALAVFSTRDDLNKIGKPTDRSLWDMPAWEQNAYYNPPVNEMVFPLGALVPPIFDINASQGANFGSIGGGWMGHELTHGFDSDGRHFDGDGNLNNWWTDQTTQEFDNRTKCLVDQANQYEVLPGVFVNGKQTLTENLADQGGVKMGYIAFLKATEGKSPAPNIGAFNERQQYWLAYAQSWCTKEAPEHIRLQVSTDVHPPAEFRANAVLFNRPEFAADFGCQAGTRMAPQNRCSVW